MLQLVRDVGGTDIGVLIDVCNDLGCAQVLLSEDRLANTFSFLFHLMPRVVRVYSCSQGLVILKVVP